MIYMGLVNGFFLCLETYISRRSDFPQLANQGGWGKKTPVRGISGQTTSSSPALKGKRDVLTKQSGMFDSTLIIINVMLDNEFTVLVYNCLL